MILPWARYAIHLLFAQLSILTSSLRTFFSYVEPEDRILRICRIRTECIFEISSVLFLTLKRLMLSAILALINRSLAFLLLTFLGTMRYFHIFDLRFSLWYTWVNIFVTFVSSHKRRVLLRVTFFLILIKTFLILCLKIN